MEPGKISQKKYITKIQSILTTSLNYLFKCYSNFLKNLLILLTLKQNNLDILRREVDAIIQFCIKYVSIFRLDLEQWKYGLLNLNVIVQLLNERSLFWF